MELSTLLGPLRLNGPKTLLARVRALRLNAELPTPVQENIEYPVSLVSSPGFAVLDSGCGKTIVGANTLSAFRKIWNDSGIEQPQPLTEENMFRFGNGASELSKESIEMPVCLAERAGTIRAAIVKGDAPRGMKSMFSDDSAWVGTYDTFYGYGTVGTVGTVRWVRWVRYGGYAGYSTGGTVGTVRWYGGYGTVGTVGATSTLWMLLHGSTLFSPTSATSLHLFRSVLWVL